jgi:hypothetical protein
MNAYLGNLQQAAEVQDVARLVLLLKDLIPDYNPGAHLLKLALHGTPKDPGADGARTSSDRTGDPVVPIYEPLTLSSRTPSAQR